MGTKKIEVDNKNDIDIFVDGEHITQTDLSKIQINHISKIYAHKREEEIPMIKLSANNVNTPKKNLSSQNIYLIWIEKIKSKNKDT